MPSKEAKGERSPNDVIAVISSQAASVRDAHSELMAKIAKVERWFSELPGRTETTCWKVFEEDFRHGNNKNLGLALHRDKKVWRLDYGFYWDMSPEDAVEWKPLSDAPVNVKLEAITMLPRLLESMEKTQRDLVKEMAKASKAVDDFIGSLETQRKEGK